MSKFFNLKSRKFWLALIFVVYSLFGWIGIPIIAKDQAITQLKSLANWDTKIESIIFNPWALSITIKELNIQDAQQQPQVAFEKLYVNFSALSSLGGTVSFDEISLTKPVINVDIDADGKVNFQKAFATDTAEEQPTEQAENASDPIALFFGLIAITEGQVHLKDQSLGETFELSLQPLNLSLEDFSTDHNDGGDYALDISIGQGQSISWKGQIGIAPFQSKGQLALNDIRSDTFWYYVKPHSPYALTQAKFSLSGTYDTEFSNDKSKLIISQGQFGIRELALAENAPENNFFTLNQFSVDGIEFDLEQSSASVKNVSISKPSVTAIKDDKGDLNLVRPLAKESMKSTENIDAEETGAKEKETAEEKQNEEEKETEATAFKWKVDNISLQEGQVVWQDQSLETPANIALENLSINLKTLSHQLDQAFPYQVSFTTQAQKHALSGKLAPLPLAVEGDLTIDALPLQMIAPYISENLNASLDSGSFALNTQYNLKAGDTAPVIGTITNAIGLNNLHLSESVSDKPFTGFEAFTIEPLTITLQENETPQTIEVGQVTLSKPYSKVYINPEGVVNLAALAKQNESEKSDSEVEQSKESEGETSDSEKENTESATPPHIVMEQFKIEDGRFEFTDASQKPAFSTYFDQIGGTIANLSSDIDAHSKVDIQGMLETYGKLLVKGTLNPLSTKPNSLIDIDVQNIDLSTASTYSARYAGYQIDKGKLNLDLSYELNDTQLKASNHVFIDQFEFGDSVDSPDATSLPLPLALGLMKNLDGEIDINLPISGDIADPSFSIGGILLTAFTNLITKIVTSPFSILGDLVDGGDDISQVRFAAQQNTIDPAQSQNILKLADVLNQRPNLTLEIRGVADANVDINQDQAALVLLAKNRAQAIRNLLVETGKIDEARIFMLEPETIALDASQDKTTTNEKDTPAYVSSLFTIGVK